MMNESLAKYLAGLLDADGTLGFDASGGYDGNVRISLKLELVAADWIDRHGFVKSLPELTGFGNVSRRQDKYTRWIVTNRADLEMLLPRIIKHMVIKAKHWQWLLEYWREYRTQEWGRRSLTQGEWRELKTQSTRSRQTNAGPLKPKNRPTWAWLAGFLDGDGCYRCKDERNKATAVAVTVHANDVCVLHFLQNAFGGSVRPSSRGEHLQIWWRGCGPRNASFALKFLPKLVKHSRLKKHKIEQMIHHLHQQRLSVSAPEGEAIV